MAILYMKLKKETTMFQTAKYDSPNHEALTAMVTQDSFYKTRLLTTYSNFTFSRSGHHAHLGEHWSKQPLNHADSALLRLGPW